MQVSLIHYTGRGTDDPWYAAKLLAFTKNTRLQMTPERFDVFMRSSSAGELTKELEYMSSTIASSWEFVDVVFAINGVSRACAQQITRTRNASFAMQSQRVTDMSAVDIYIPPHVPKEMIATYKAAHVNAMASYDALVRGGTSFEDARGVLPINVLCNLIAKYNLRSWVDLVRARSSLRVQDEYREVIRKMKYEVLSVWPWVATFLEPKQNKSIALIEELAQSFPPGEQRTKMAKAADLLKKETA